MTIIVMNISISDIEYNIHLLSEVFFLILFCLPKIATNMAII